MGIIQYPLSASMGTYVCCFKPHFLNAIVHEVVIRLDATGIFAKIHAHDRKHFDAHVSQSDMVFGQRLVLRTVRLVT